MGDWSMSMTLSSASMPSMPSCAPGRVRARFRSRERALRTISLTSVDLPEPETPVTQVKTPSGMRTSMFLRLCSRAPRTSSSPVGLRRCAGTAIFRAPERNCPVREFGLRMISSAVPQATTSPPCTPAPGPMSTM